jgi:TRAP-type C4-dicarboxylate transport system substrate-binding protein
VPDIFRKNKRSDFREAGGMSGFHRRVAGMACAAFLSTIACANAQPVELKLATFGPPQSYFYVEVLIPFLEAVNRDSQGTVNIKYFGGGVLGNAGNMYDSVLTGAADIGWALLGSVPGKFVKASVVELPFGYNSGEIGAIALWRLYDKGLIASDFDQVKLFGLTAWPGAEVQSKSKKVQTLEDMKGLKLRAQGKWQAATVNAFGATPVSVPVDEVYQALDRGVIDGTWSSLVLTGQFRVDEIAHYFLEAPLNGGGGMLIMKKESYDALPAAAKAAFEKHSGEVMSRALGKSNDGEVVRVRAQLAALAAKGKVEAPYSLSPEESARWKKAAEPVAEAWAKAVPNGPEILAAFRAETARLAAETK